MSDHDEFLHGEVSMEQHLERVAFVRDARRRLSLREWELVRIALEVEADEVYDEPQHVDLDPEMRRWSALREMYRAAQNSDLRFGEEYLTPEEVIQMAQGLGLAETDLTMP